MKEKKKMSLKTTLIFSCVSLVLAVALIVGNVFALKYETLLNVFFSESDYSVSQEEKEKCEEIVAEGAVLLKNEDGALPLKENERKVALLGQNSVDFVYGGAGSGSVDTSSAPDMKKAFERAGFTVNQTLWDFYKNGAGKNYRKKTPDASGKGSFQVNEVPLSVYTDKEKNSLDSDDVAVCVIGRSGGESADLPTQVLPTGSLYLQIDKNELDTIQLACSKFDKVILLINASNPVELGILEDAEFANVKAAVWCGGVGQEGLYAVPEILKGTVNPSGRLPDTYAYDSTSAPSFANLGNYSITNSTVNNGNKYIVYQEGIYTGYRYYETRYEDYVLGRGNAGVYGYASTVQFPFGYGLSYSDFGWSDFEVKESEDKKSFDVSLTVKNNGPASGKDVVEIYMQAPYKENGIEKSSVVLVGFAKTKLLAKDEEQTLSIKADKQQLTSYDYKNAKTYVLDEGEYYFTAARDAHDAVNNILSAKSLTGQQAARMSGSGNPDLVGSYNQETYDNTTYKFSAENKDVEITNRFDDADVNYYEDCEYVSRSDWEGTLPAGAFMNGSWQASAKMLADLEFYRADEVINDASKKMPEFNSNSTSYVVSDLIDTPLNDTKWDDLVNRLSYKQMTKLIRVGGYATIQIDKIQLPATIDKDGPAGISGTLVGGESCMAWPAEVVMAATWNSQLVEEMGKLMGEDSIQAGVAGWYAPGVNIHRSPFSGRNFEYFSEDGLLSGKIGAAEVQGVRSKGVIPYMKHFALNDQETNRYGGAIFANEQAIREVWLKGFEYVAREGGATAAMASMNRIGARWAGAHKGLMTDVLRGEWGFKGMVITDQASVPSMFYQDMISGLWAGTDIWLNTNADYWSLDDWKDNPTVMSYAHNAAKNIIYSIVNSNAVQDYKSGGIKEDAMVGMQPWKIGLIVLDVVIFAACAAGILLPVTMYLRGRKRNTTQE